MRTGREDAMKGTREFYFASRKLLSYSGGVVKIGMLGSIFNMIGLKITNAHPEDIEKASSLTEAEWMLYASPKFYPGYFAPKKQPKEEEANEEPQEEQLDLQLNQHVLEQIDYTAMLEGIDSLITGLGKILIIINDKLDKMTELQREMISCWKSE